MAPIDIHEPGETPRPHEQEEAAVGIDLGTTNSLVAIADQGKPQILRDRNGLGIIPSVVAYGDHIGDTTVGEEARARLFDEPDQVVSSIKRLMGRGVGDIKTLSGTLPFEIEDGAEFEGGMVRLKISGRSVSPVEISADILRALKLRAETALSQNVGQAVVTVPAYFDDAARAATKDAAHLAGLEVLRLVNEPTAAALAYGLDHGSEGVYAVYDLGGGTFDISLLHLTKGVFQVLATGGDSALGGDDFDHAIAEHFLAERNSHVGPTETTSNELKLLLQTAREAKESLSVQGEGEWLLDIGGKESRHFLDVSILETLIGSMVNDTMGICRRVLEDAERGPGEIHGVVLVGGSTRLPLVRRAVGELFGCEPLANIDPDEVVALGAALQAEALTRGSDALLLDVTPLSVGIETMGGLVEKIIPRNTPIPGGYGQEFTTYQDGQQAMMVHVVQGERELVDQNRSLAKFTLNGIPPMAAGAARILVTFSIDADGLLTVSAQEKTSGEVQTVEVKPSYGLSDDELAQMLEASMEHAREDMAKRMLIEARVEADRAIMAVKAALSVDGDLLSEIEKIAIENALAGAERAMAGNNFEVIHGWVDRLDEETQFFAERRMDRGIRNSLQGVAVTDLERQVGEG